MILKPNKCISTNTKKLSSWIEGFKYFKKDRELVIYPKKGRPFILEGVPKKIVEKFYYSDSLGRFYHRHLKGVYKLSSFILPTEAELEACETQDEIDALYDRLNQ